MFGERKPRAGMYTGAYDGCGIPVSGLRQCLISFSYKPHHVRRIRKTAAGSRTRLDRIAEDPFGYGGVDPWEYGLTGQVTTLPGLRRLDLRYKRTRSSGARMYDTQERYETIFKTLAACEKEHGHGPTRNQLHESIGFRPWLYLQDLVRLGVLDKKKLPKERLYTPPNTFLKP